MSGGSRRPEGDRVEGREGQAKESCEEREREKEGEGKA